MGFRNLCKTLRFFSAPYSSYSIFLFSNTKPSTTTTPFSRFFTFTFTLFHSQNSFLFSTGYLSFCSHKNPFVSSSSIYTDTVNAPSCLGIDLQFHALSTRKYFCSYPYSSHLDRPYATPEQVSDIVALILPEDVNDLGSRLNGMNLSLSLASIVQVFHVLASERVSALRFFDWLKDSHPEIWSDPEIGCLVIDNCGLLGNFEEMVPILTEFNLKGVSLRRKAFGFLMVLGSDKASSMDCVGKIVDVLNEVGGVCQSSGFQLLIEMFSVWGLFDIVEFVLEASRRKSNHCNMLIRRMCKSNHCNMLIRRMCKRGDCESARDLLKEMKRSGWEPNKTTYNLLISCLCKNGKNGEAFQILETIEEDYGVGSTFDILINSSCKHHQFDLVSEFLNKMALKGIEPCISTHAAVIKSYFASGKYEEAHEYVVGTAVKQSCSSNANYSLLAGLHLKRGNVRLAQKILYEMMDRGLKPNFSVYMKIRKCLQKKNESDLSLELLRRYTSLIEK